MTQATSSIIQSLGLRDLTEISHTAHNDVWSGSQNNQPVILKLSTDTESLKQEAVALQAFAGQAAIKVIVEEEGMLLMERAIPGTSLKHYFAYREQESIDICVNLIKSLHQAKIPESYDFPHIKDWLTVLDKEQPIHEQDLHKARTLRDNLLEDPKKNVLLHGDLHHDNILQHGSDWVVIDPKGVIGEPAYEVAAFIRNPIPDLLNHSDAKAIIARRITQFAEHLAIPSQRIHDWCFVQAVVAWIWALEDGDDPRYFQKLTEVFRDAST